MSFIPYARQSINETDIYEVSESLKGDLITRGSRVEAFEHEMAQYCGAKFGVAFQSGTAALMAAYHAAELNAADRLITTPNSFVATVGAAMQLKTRPVFLDIDRSTGNMSLESIKINTEYKLSRGRPIIAPVHYAGIPVDMRKLDQMICDPTAVVIEDAAHALGSSYPSGEKVGSCRWSHMTIFSFHPNKNITTGEGGMVMTNDEKLHHRLCLFRNNGIERDPNFLQKQGLPWYYEVQELSGNYNFTEMQASLGLSQLKRLDEFVDKRRRLVKRYRKRLEGKKHIRLLTSEYDKNTAFHLFVVQIDFAAIGKSREKVMLDLRDKGIGTQVLYIPIYKHPFFKDHCKEDLSEYFPNMEAFYSQALALPLYYDLSEEQVDYICKSLRI